MLSRGVKDGVSGLVDNTLAKLVSCEERVFRVRGDDISRGAVLGDWGDSRTEQSDVVRERWMLCLEGQPL
jgi:hypothetical protein